MRKIIDPVQIKEIEKFMSVAVMEAYKSTCKKSKRGAVIVNDGEIIGKGYNEVTYDKMCNSCVREGITDGSRKDLCSAIHAEQMAILDVNSKESLKGATIYHVKVKNNKVVVSGNLSCTVCSRIILKSGISKFVLWQKEGYIEYGAEEANELSFEYFL